MLAHHIITISSLLSKQHQREFNGQNIMKINRMIIVLITNIPKGRMIVALKM